MKLWLISQNENNGYDSYDSAVVAANTEDEARKIHPSDYIDWDEASFSWGYKKVDGSFEPLRYSRGDWANRYQDVQAEYVGEAKKGTVPGVICASFNAG